MRRTSVIGPLLLILAGLAFLIRNVWPEVPIFDLIAQYWPFLLIAWGALRLIEIMFWAMSAKPLPRGGMAAGEWVIVIFICLIGSAMYTTRHYSSWMPNGRSIRGMVINMGETYDYNVEPVLQASGPAPRVILENFRGNARIIGVDGDQVKANGRKTIRAFQQAEADKANTETPLQLIARGGDIVIRTNQDRVSDSLRVSADLEISVPKGASLEAHGRYGDFDVRDLSGNIEINSDNAGVRIDNAGGSVRLELRKSDVVRATGVKGSVELKGRGQDVDLQNVDGQVTISGDFLGQIQLKNLNQPVRFEGTHVDLQCEKIPGQLHMGLGEFTANNVVGPIRLTSKARDVQITDFTQSLDLNLDRGDVELRPGRGPLPKIDVKTKSGDIDLSLPQGARFELKLSTNRGEAHNEYGDPLTVNEQSHGATIGGSVGTGPQLHLETGRGTVTARKGAAEDLKVEQQ